MLDISCAFATSFETPDHVRVAEELGYRRAWLYDSPALYPDVWVTLALAAERTSHIGLGPGVLVPSLRHPMVTAAAIAQLCHLAPGRVEIAVGSGFTGRMVFGQRPLPWSNVRDYVATLRALLRGEKTPWDGKMIQMIHPAGFAPARPIDIPVLIGAAGPKGVAAAEDLADGIIASAPLPLRKPGMRCALISVGTVLDEGEDPASARVLAAAGHAAAVALHAMYDAGSDMSKVPGGPEWKAPLDALPESERHLHLHERHLIAVNERDRPLITGAFMRRIGAARTAAEWRAWMETQKAAGATEVAFQPGGPDIPGELRRFAAAAGLL